MVTTPGLKRFLFLSILSCLVSLSGAHPVTAGGPVIRETREIVINGVKEEWRLEWSASPREVCGPDDPDWMTCPCMGFAFGEGGTLTLVRKVPGKEEERLELGPLFSGDGHDSPGEKGEAVLRRWGERKSDLEQQDRPGFPDKVRSRPVLRVIHFGDYDRDGRASEFLLQVGTLPCGKKMNVIIGISRKKEKLHVFTSVDRPDRPLVLQAWQWEKLRWAKGAIRVVSWPCGDHGSDAEAELELRADRGAIHSARREFQCTADGKRGKLIKKESF